MEAFLKEHKNDFERTEELGKVKVRGAHRPCGTSRPAHARCRIPSMPTVALYRLCCGQYRCVYTGHEVLADLKLLEVNMRARLFVSFR